MQLPNLTPLIPEMIMTAVALAVLMLDLIVKKKEILAYATIAGVLIAFYTIPRSAGVTFNGMFISDPYCMFFKVIFFINIILTILISIKYLKIEDSFHGEYYSLLVFATIGMMFMVSAGDLIVLYLGLELMALSTYVLAGFIRHDTRSTESAVKYFLLGAFSSAILLYGMSLMYGFTGTTSLSGIHEYIVTKGLAKNAFLLLGMVMFVAAFSFKIAAAPFHMWAPDVYEGAPTSVTAFMSVGPKAAGFAIFARVFLSAFASLTINWIPLLIPIAILTMATGSILALAQTNIKRMLAYSSIAHAGYALLGIISSTREGISAMMNYLLIYAFMNIGAFAVVILMRTKDAKGDDIHDYEGLSHTHPLVAFLMLVLMFSLAGLPPTAGFIGKFYLIMAAIHSGHPVLAIGAVLFSAISAFFYLRIVMFMYMKESKQETPIAFTLPIGAVLFVATVMVLVIGIFPQPFIELARRTLVPA